MFGKILSLTVNICAYGFRVYSFLYVIKYIIVNDYLCHLCGVILTLKSNGCDICISQYVQVDSVTSCTCRASSRVVSSMLCSFQVIESQVNMALYTIVLLGHDG